VLSWDIPVGRLALLYPTTYHVGTWAKRLRRLIPQADVVVVVRGDYSIYGPRLEAVDADNPERVYEPDWTDLARTIGMPAPWWPPAMRSAEDMLRWRPGSPAIQTQAAADTDMTPLLRLAADQPEGSSIQRALLHTARTMLQAAASSARGELEILEKLPHRDAIAVAATPLPPPPLDDVPEVVRRDGWAAVLERTDDLAGQCVQAALMWDGGRDFPFARTVLVQPADPVSAEWAATLVPSPWTVAYRALDLGRDKPADTLRDPLTGLPAARMDTGLIRAGVPRMLPATTPLAQVLLRGEVAWIRTQDGTLFITPQPVQFGWSWGYEGTGPRILVRLLELLLDDITAPANRILDKKEVNAGLLRAVASWKDGDTISRAELLAARAQK
jgi:hypothetical protein